MGDITQQWHLIVFLIAMIGVMMASNSMMMCWCMWLMFTQQAIQLLSRKENSIKTCSFVPQAPA